MKAIVIASIVFFSLRAMSADVGENLKSPCEFAVQSNKREAKILDIPAFENSGVVHEQVIIK